MEENGDANLKSTHPTLDDSDSAVGGDYNFHNEYM